jgi:hypothetical protein
MIAMRRWFECVLRGDVVVRFASETSYNDFVVIYVDNAEDAQAVWDEWADWIVRVEEPLP